MISAERRTQIKTILLQKKSVTVAEVAKHFDVSTETIRRDFEALAAEGFLIKSYGGATLAVRKNMPVSQKIKSGILIESKRRMAKEAAKLVRPNDCIFLDHSTTVYEMCEELAGMPLTVMTNSLAVINRMAEQPNIKLVIPGGNFDANNQAFFGLEAVQYLKRHSFDKAFLSCRTLDIRRGLGDAEEMIADMRRNIIESSDFNCLLIDSTKLGKSAFVQTCDYRNVHSIITDKKLDDTWTRFLQEQEIRYVECPEADEEETTVK